MATSAEGVLIKGVFPRKKSEMINKYENKLDAMHLEQFETLTDEELSNINGGKNLWNSFMNWWQSPQGRAVDYWYWVNVESQGGTPFYMHRQ